MALAIVDTMKITKYQIQWQLTAILCHLMLCISTILNQRKIIARENFIKVQKVKLKIRKLSRLNSKLAGCFGSLYLLYCLPFRCLCFDDLYFRIARTLPCLIMLDRIRQGTSLSVAISS